MIASEIDHFEQFRRVRRDNKSSRSKNEEIVSLLLSNFGNEVYDCSENFIQQGIEFKDLASLNREDLLLFRILDYEKQTEMLETFTQLTTQDYNLNEIKNSSKGKTYNGQIIDNAASFLDMMHTTLAAANLKLKLKPSEDILIEEKKFASKFLLEAFKELQILTINMENEIVNLEKICCHKKIFKEQRNFMNHLPIAVLTLLGLTFAFWKLR